MCFVGNLTLNIGQREFWFDDDVIIVMLTVHTRNLS